MSPEHQHSAVPRRARIFLAGALSALILVLGPTAGVAMGQSAADQYGSGSVTGNDPGATPPGATDPGTTTPGTTVPDTPDEVADDTAEVDDPGSTDDVGTTDTDSTTGDDEAGSGSGSGAGSGSGSGSAATGTGTGSSAAGASSTVNSGPLRVDYASFGTIDSLVRSDVEEAIREAGLRFRFVSISDARLARFLDTAFAKSLSSGGPQAVGRVVGRTLTQGAAPAPELYRTLFPSITDPFSAFVATVLSRSDAPKNDQDRFSRGVGAGFGSRGVPAIYVERTDAKTSHVDEYEDIPGVAVVDDIDTDAGKAKLISLLTSGSTGQTASAAAPKIDADTASSILEATSSDETSTGPLLALIALLGAGVLVAGGVFRRRSARK